MLHFGHFLGLTCERDEMSKLARALSNIALPTTRMVELQHRKVMMDTPWVANALPGVVVVLIAARALVYWIYRVANEKQSARR